MYRILLFAALVSQVQWVFSLHCENGWVIHGSKCFWKSTAAVVREGNLKKCQSMGASLVSIRSAEENAFIKKFIGEQAFYWLGGYRVKQGSREFKWVDGSTFTYNDWFHPVEPDNINDRGPVCVSIKPGRGWNDWSCNFESKQLCEKPAQQEPKPVAPKPVTPKPTTPKPTTQKPTTPTPTTPTPVPKCDCNKLETEIKELKSTNSKNAAELAGVKNENSKQEKQMKELNENYKKCEEGKGSLKKEDSSHEKELAELKTRIAKYEKEIQDANGKIKLLEGEVEKERSKDKRLEKELETAQAELSGLTYKLVIVRK